MVAVSVHLPCLKPYNTPFRVVVYHNMLFNIDAQTFHMTSTKIVPLYYSPPLGISTIVVHVSSVGMRPSRNTNFSNLPVYPTIVCLVPFPVLHLLSTPSYNIP